MSSSYQRIGTSDYYYDPATGMFWDGSQGGQRWITREVYDRITEEKWRQFNATLTHPQIPPFVSPNTNPSQKSFYSADFHAVNHAVNRTTPTYTAAPIPAPPSSLIPFPSTSDPTVLITPLQFDQPSGHYFDPVQNRWINAVEYAEWMRVKEEGIHNERIRRERSDKEAQTKMARFIQRCLTNESGREREMEVKIEKYLGDLRRHGELNTVDWDAHPILTLPPVPMQKRNVPNEVMNGNGWGSMGGNETYDRYGGGGGDGSVKRKRDRGGREYGGNNGAHGSSNSYYGPGHVHPESSSSPPPPTDPYYGNDYSNYNYNNKNGFDMNTSTLTRRSKRFRTNSTKNTSSTASATSTFGVYMGASTINGNRGGNSGADRVNKEMDYEKMTVVGTCRKEEKEYLRLTQPPKPEFVRTVLTLQNWHDKLVSMIKSPKGYKYEYVCSQYKAIRQDLTVQRVNTTFTVQVYETHGRIALENGDLNEFNQCQTQLASLYHIFSCDGVNPQPCKNVGEFVAYGLLYACLIREKGGNGDTPVIKALEEIERGRVGGKGEYEGEEISHALDVRRSMYMEDFTSFSRLYAKAPKMSAYIMDHMIPTVRFRALQVLVKAFKPTVGGKWAVGMLGFYPIDGNEFEGTTGEEEIERGKKYLKSCGCLILEDEGDVRNWKVDTKNSTINMPQESGEEGK